jgi:hypothetical protein
MKIGDQAKKVKSCMHFAEYSMTKFLTKSFSAKPFALQRARLAQNPKLLLPSLLFRRNLQVSVLLYEN